MQQNSQYLFTERHREHVIFIYCGVKSSKGFDAVIGAAPNQRLHSLYSIDNPTETRPFLGPALPEHSQRMIKVLSVKDLIKGLSA